MKLVDTHLAHSLVLSGSNVDLACFGFLLTCDEDEVPLFSLMHCNLLLEGMAGQVDLDVVAKSVEIEVHLLAVVEELLREWYDDGLSWRDKEWPFTSGVLDQDGHETLNRSEDGSMDHDWSGETWLDGLLLPLPVIGLVLISLVHLGHHDLVLVDSWVEHVVLVLKVKPDWELEVELDGTALVESLQ